MRFPILILLTFFASSVWAQQQLPTTVFEKRQGKVMRIVKYKKIDVVSEKSFTIPKYTHDEITLFGLDHYLTTYNKSRMLQLVSDFLIRNKKNFTFDKLNSISIDCYFDKYTFDIKEITYIVPAGSLSNFSILRKLTEEIKIKGDLSIKDNFKARVEEYRTYWDEYAPMYFRLHMNLSYSNHSFAQLTKLTRTYEQQSGAKILKIKSYSKVDQVSDKAFPVKELTNLDDIAAMVRPFKELNYERNKFLSVVRSHFAFYNDRLKLDKLQGTHVQLELYYDPKSYQLLNIRYSFPSGLVPNYTGLDKLTQNLILNGGLAFQEMYKRKDNPVGNYIKVLFSIFYSDIVEDIN